MIAVITGDIVNSRSESAAHWLPVLKKILGHYGEAPQGWEISRGDSFQLLLQPEEALYAALQIKAGIKQLPDLDVRMAIGIGEQEYKAEKISESNGSAFIRSGECFEELKKQNLGIRTGEAEKDEIFDLLFQLALLSMNNWSVTVAKTIAAFLEHPAKNQTELAKHLKKSQSSLSEALKRGGFDEIMQLESFYRSKIKRL
ncbi:transcriptional regulator [Salinimicrobium tongyeongense]|uniref:Transcriptional regulator n=1 Tax=Salinimicrobium tongyeongense TaxID=2809707 RepID=A0ABY6NQR1_9FLAO|nr:SatD family protein [Salinimicrobium tongyeongense]UZH55244.1 transcriptional regulator [Salinimicrobium tongyeongense]